MTFARVRAFVVVGVLFTAAAIFVVIALVKDTQSDGTAGGGCPDGYVAANIRLPEENKEVKIKVFNATTRSGLADTVGDDFSHRGFTVDKKRANNDKTLDDVAVLRYGPKAVGNAWLLRAYFLNEATLAYDKDRTNDVVDVVIGKQYLQLATETEVKQALSQLGNPVLPAGACEADDAA